MFVGTWNDNVYGSYVTYVFNEDGSFEQGYSDYISEAGTWSVKNNKLCLDYSESYGGTDTCFSYLLNDNKLDLKVEGLTVMTLLKEESSNDDTQTDDSNNDDTEPDDEDQQDGGNDFVGTWTDDVYGSQVTYIFNEDGSFEYGSPGYISEAGTWSVVNNKLCLDYSESYGGTDTCYGYSLNDNKLDLTYGGSIVMTLLKEEASNDDTEPVDQRQYGGDSNIVGTWNYSVAEEFSLLYYFNADGSLQIGAMGVKSDAGHWYTENNYLCFEYGSSYDATDACYTYSISGNSLTLYYNGIATMTFNKAQFSVNIAYKQSFD